MIDDFVMKGDRMLAAPRASMEARERLASPPMPGPDACDAALLARCRLEADAFTGIYDKYFPVMHRYIAGRLGVQAADDLAAEAPKRSRARWPSRTAPSAHVSTAHARSCAPR